MAKWQPMSTAPRDGTRILVRYKFTNQEATERWGEYGFFVVNWEPTRSVWRRHYGDYENEKRLGLPALGVGDLFKMEWLLIPDDSTPLGNGIVDYLDNMASQELQNVRRQDE